jgi:uncharacterized protein (DUF1697 family)
MAMYIALFRGINVIGRRIVPMKELKVLLGKAGCLDVQTYIQSGNALFRSDADPATLSKQLAAAVSKRYGFEPHVIVKTRAQLERAAAGNPFPEADARPTTLHLFFLAKAARKADIASLEALRASSEQFALKGTTFYLYTPDGFGSSKLAQRAERLLGVEATARNWRTVKTLIELARGRAAP